MLKAGYLKTWQTSYCCLIWYVWPWCIPLQVVSHIIQCDTLMTRDLDLKVCFCLMAHAVWFLLSSLQQGVIAGRENSLMEDCHHAPHLCPCCLWSFLQCAVCLLHNTTIVNYFIAHDVITSLALVCIRVLSCKRLVYQEITFLLTLLWR